jgi:pimeloyl-ACP methyl ester carboxylesterase
MSGYPTAHLARSQDLADKVSRVFQARAKLAQERLTGRVQKAFTKHVGELVAKPPTPWDAWAGWSRYTVDVAQRWVLLWDTLRQRGNAFVEHTREGLPPVLHFTYEMVLDARTFERPVNYALVRITPPAGVTVDPTRRPYVIIDPRAGHGPGIGGFKDDSQVGVALAAGHPVYFVIFFPEPADGQTLLDVCAAEQAFVREVRALHPASPKPVIIGNCQGGWAAMMLAAADPEATGPIVINGAPMSYWGGAWKEGEGDNPMRYAGGLLGGTWLASLASDLGHGKFDGAWLVQNFENLNPANTFWEKYYHLFANVDTEPPRFLEFERWWGGFYLMNREEIEWITRNLFVGNTLWSGAGGSPRDKVFDLREIKAPIILFASMGDNITPPQQAFNWVADVYGSTEEIKARGQVIVGLLHQDIGHLGIFVSGKVARKEHAQIVSVLESIEALPAGLYGMQILERRSADGAVQYGVQFVERRLEDVMERLNRFKRADEKPFEAVAAMTEFNQRAYELFLQPLVQAMSSEPLAKLGRAVHPLRLQRWAVSDYYNPWVWWLGPIADAVRAQRKPGAGNESAGEAPRMMAVHDPWLWWFRPLPAAAGAQQAPASDAAPGWARMMTEYNPWLWWLRLPTDATGTPQWVVGDDEPARRIERMMSEATSAALDYYRDMRDAISEAAFFLTYGNLFSLYLADKRETEERTSAAAVPADPRDLPFVKEALASLEQGGYAEALARIGALINRDDERIPLTRLELRRDLAQDYAEFLPAMPRAEMRRIRGEQDIIVRYEPERALDTLPKLLADPADRDRLLALITRLLGDERMRARQLSAEDLARIDAILAVLGAAPIRPATKMARSD